MSNLRYYLFPAIGSVSETRIRHTGENLERPDDLRGELDKQIDHLQRQARSAEKYTEYKQEERLTRAQLQALRWDEFNQDTQETSQTAQVERARINQPEQNIINQQRCSEKLQDEWGHYSSDHLEGSE